MRTILIFLFSVSVIFSQDYNDYFSKEAEIKILVDDMNLINVQVNQLIEELQLKVEDIDIDISKKVGRYVFLTDRTLFEEVISRFEAIGPVRVKKISTKNNINALEKNAFDLMFLNEQKDAYSGELEGLDKTDKNYKELWNKTQEFNKKIYENNKMKIQLTHEVENYRIVFTVEEKRIQDLDEEGDEWFNFINMPGVESYFFNVENPDPAFSAQKYMGGSLRYLFTKGKTFFTIGILKPFMNEGTQPSTQANDIVTYTLGKDFYPRYLGRGKRTFFNPYSGFQIGGMILTSQDKIEHFFTVEPHIGIEIFKNKYVIVDVRAGYLFPLDVDLIKEFRGLTQNITFNIVF